MPPSYTSSQSKVKQTQQTNSTPTRVYKVIYKIVTKVISNFLYLIMHQIISFEHRKYIECMKILYVLSLYHEEIHALKNINTLGMLIKFDMHKSFYRLNGKFLENILMAFKLYHIQTIWVLNLFLNTFFSMLFSRVLSTPFIPSKGIRKSDPLSLFLFQLIAEGMSCSLNIAHILANNTLVLYGSEVSINYSKWYASLSWISKFFCIIHQPTVELATKSSLL